MRLLQIFFLLFGITGLAFGTNLSVSVVKRIDKHELTTGTELKVTWENGWKNERNHDASWIVVKHLLPGSFVWRHTKIRSAKLANPDPTKPPRFAVRIAPDETALLIETTESHRGKVQVTIYVDLAPEAFANVKEPSKVKIQAHGTEMVFVPSGSFFVGETHPRGFNHGALFKVGASRELFEIGSEDAIDIANQAGKLYYDYPATFSPTEVGDKLGPIPASFPKGFAAFYCMKYEITQGQYAQFLNSLSHDGIGFRSMLAHPDYRSLRGSIVLRNGKYSALAPNEPLNHVGWEDGSAWLAWMALRPMTELEFTKASRGPGRPVPRDYPWGTDSKVQIARTFGQNGRLGLSSVNDEAKLTDSNREQFGASYYWIMDLGSAYWERVITFGSPAGRAFTGVHGDGNLYYGFQFVASWPKGDIRGSGYGYRGGGYYDAKNPGDEHVPHSPTEYRRYGAWSDGPRTMAYGFRGVRSGF